MLIRRELVFITLILANCFSGISQNKQIDSAHVYLSKALDFSYKNRPFSSYKYYIGAKEIYEDMNQSDCVAECNLGLFRLLDAQKDLKEYLNKDPLPYLDAYHNYAVIYDDTYKLLAANYFYASHYFEDTIKKDISIQYYNKALAYALILKREKSQANIYSNLAHFYSTRTSKKDSAYYYFDKALTTYPPDSSIELFQTNINYSILLEKDKKYKLALKKLKKAEEYSIHRYQKRLKKVLFSRYSDIYGKLKNYTDSYFYLKEVMALRDSLENNQQNIAIIELDVKHRTAETENALLKNQQRNERMLLVLLGMIALIIFGGSISYLTLKNSRKKHLLAVREKELETQKNLTLLKEQEITSINAMVAGQEKERKRVAEDLHDNLGSVLATLKLHFENLKMNRKKKKIDQEALFDKTEGLIDEAYKKVRSIAHAKNAGVIANQGLLVAVKMMAEKISSADKITIDVIHYGLGSRLKNSMELTVFRIIQELVTNIIKHAEASRATINLSQFDKNLNIIIEDNGKGFAPKKVDSKSGMGIHSIQTRIEHLNGTFEIDSTPEKGTSILIDLPVT